MKLKNWKSKAKLVKHYVINDNPDEYLFYALPPYYSDSEGRLNINVCVGDCYSLSMLYFDTQMIDCTTYVMPIDAYFDYGKRVVKKRFGELSLGDVFIWNNGRYNFYSIKCAQGCIYTIDTHSYFNTDINPNAVVEFLPDASIVFGKKA